ncbi:MAG: filamentous hemagglutinin N-terminal domain-containing protein [Verrucomicrobia bacterium]|nr:filamentous hemagglutinin N-terminal domain-containing protein [Verrucomicrobiota bacterium]
MNKKLNNNFSLKKLLLTALVSGPLATLPAPLWALPDVTAANLTTSAGVTTQLVGANTLNVTSPDKAILTWQAFGSLGTGSITNSTIGANDIINYFLPTASGSVLNTVSGGVASTINGQILSNGNVYILNPAGIVISNTAQINVGGFYASTVSEPSGFFAINGTLSYAGTSNSNVVVQGTGVTGGTDTAQIQAVGTGNNIYLAGQAVDVQGGKFFGNLFVRASNASGTIAGMGGNNVRFGETGPVSINLVGAALTGGGLNITSNGGNVKLTGGTTASLTGLLASTPVGTLTTIATGTGGTGYNAAPVVTISAPSTGGVQATATARVNSAGLVEGYTIVNPGSGYNGLTPTATLTVTGSGINTTAAAPVVSGDFISAITPSLTQTGYAASPSVTIPAPTTGVTAAATAIVNTSGVITGYAITNAGSGYSSAPTVTVAAPGTGTSGAPGAAGITLAGVGLALVTGASSGSNYGTAVPTVTFSGGGGTGAIATANLASGVVTGYSIVSAGSGYTSAPTVTVSAPTNGSLTLAPNVASTKGSLSIDTNGNGVQGSITQGASAITASTSGQTLALNAGAGGNITLGAIDALTIGATGNNISVTDTAGDLTLNATTAAGNLTVVGAGSILQGSGTHSITGAITLTPAASKTVTFTGAGDLTFASIGSTSTITISTPGNITFNRARAARLPPARSRRARP